MARVILYGLGEIGLEIAKLCLERGMQIVGVIDISVDKVGKDVGELLGGEKIGIIVSDKAEDVLPQEADIVLHTTTSSLKEAAPQILEAVKAGKNVISTCEELIFPYLSNAELAKQLDSEARKANVTVLGSGVNPGFVMDNLAVSLVQTCRSVDEVYVKRVINNTKRRPAFQKKTGLGRIRENFEQKLKAGEAGHVGLRESAGLIAHSLGWSCKDLQFNEKAKVVSESEKVRGVKQTCIASSGKKKIILDFQAYFGAKEEDVIQIKGEPDVNMKLEGGLHGDVATVARMVNFVGVVMDARAGLVLRV